MRRAGVAILWLLAVLAGVVFALLVVVPWLALAGYLKVPGLTFDQSGAITMAEAASLAVAGAAGLLALVTVLLAVQAHRTVIETQLMAGAGPPLLQSGCAHLIARLPQVVPGEDLVAGAHDQAA